MSTITEDSTRVYHRELCRLIRAVRLPKEIPSAHESRQAHGESLRAQISRKNDEIRAINKKLESTQQSLTDCQSEQAALIRSDDIGDQVTLENLEKTIGVAAKKLAAFKTDRKQAQAEAEGLTAELNAVTAAEAKAAESDKVADRVNTARDEAARIFDELAGGLNKLRAVCTDLKYNTLGLSRNSADELRKCEDLIVSGFQFEVLDKVRGDFLRFLRVKDWVA